MMNETLSRLYFKIYLSFQLCLQNVKLVMNQSMVELVNHVRRTGTVKDVQTNVHVKELKGNST